MKEPEKGESPLAIRDGRTGQSSRNAGGLNQVGRVFRGQARRVKTPSTEEGPASYDAGPWIKSPSQFALTDWGLLPGGSLTSPIYREQAYFGH